MLVVMLAETSACQRFRTMAAASLAVVGRKSSVAAMLPATAGLAVRLNTGQLGVPPVGSTQQHRRRRSEKEL